MLLQLPLLLLPLLLLLLLLLQFLLPLLSPRQRTAVGAAAIAFITAVSNVALVATGAAVA